MARLVRSAPLGVLSAEDDFRGPWPVVDPSASGYCVFGPAYLDDQGGRAAAVVPLPKSARSAVRKVCPEAAYLVQFDCGLVVALPAVAAALWCSSFYLVPTVSGWAVVCDPAAAAHVADGTHPSRPGVAGYYEFNDHEGWRWWSRGGGVVDLGSATEDGVLCFICCDPARSPAAAAEWVLDSWCPGSLNGELSVPSWSDPAPAAPAPGPLVVPAVPEEVVARALSYLEAGSDAWRRPRSIYCGIEDVRQMIIEAWSAGYSAAAPAPVPPVVDAVPGAPAPAFDPAGVDSVAAGVLESFSRLAAVPGALAYLAAVCQEAGVVL